MSHHFPPDSKPIPDDPEDGQYYIHGFIQKIKTGGIYPTEKHECKIIVRFSSDETDKYTNLDSRYIAYPRVDDPNKQAYCSLPDGTEVRMIVIPNKKAILKGEIVTLKVVEDD